MSKPLPRDAQGGPAAGTDALAGRDLAVTLGGSRILNDLTVGFRCGAVTALVGANGSGKSTLLRALSRLVAPDHGTVALDGADIARLPARALARKLAILPQSSEAPAGITVADLVGYGRYPHRALLGGLGPADRDAIDWAISATGIGRHRDRAVDTLSGGERQRAWIAMALAQRTDLLLLDEPTTYLDVRHQIEVLDLIRGLNRDYGLTVVWVLHDLNQAASHSDHVVLLRHGGIFREGPPEAVMTPETVRAVFGIDVLVLPHPETGAPICLPRGAQAASARPEIQPLRRSHR